MIPLRGTIPSKRFPLMTLVMIVLNAAVFLFQRTLGTGFEDFVQRYGLVSAGAVAWWAHVGGFATGMFFVFPFRKYR